MSAPKDMKVFEEERLKELYSLGILDTHSEESYDRITKLITKIFQVPIALVSLVDANRQWIKSGCGFDAKETSREVSFCAHAIQEPELLIIPDAKNDSRFADNPLVQGEPYIRFYAGAVFRGPTSQPLGTLCLIDHKSRTLNDEEKAILVAFAHIVESEIIRSYHSEKLKKEIIKSSLYNELTGLPNRRFIDQILSQKIENARHGDDQKLLVLAISFQDLKKLNVALGRGTNFSILKAFGKRINKNIKTGDFVGQWQDDMLVLATAIKKTQEIMPYVMHIREAVDEQFELNGTEVRLDTRIGTSVFPEYGGEAGDLIENAIKAIPAVPAAQAPFGSFHPDHDRFLSRNFQIETRLRIAIETGELGVVYQPKVDLATGLIVGAEALVRWTDSELGFVPPSEFVPLAEKSGLIFALGDQVTQTACRQTLEILQKDIAPVTVAVNLSSAQLLRKGFISWIRKLLEDTCLPGKYLNIEVTESTIIEDIEKAVKNMTEANRLGITFSIDDFGTGHSSLRNLQRLPLNTLKIDKSFIDEIVTKKSDAAIAQATIAMAHSLGIKVVAEGVENREQLFFLRAYNCDKIQGYIFSKPLPFSEYVELLEKREPFLV